MTKQEFLDDVWTGLTREQKTLPCKYFYDEQGSELFERICEQQEYYLTRVEVALLESIKSEIATLIGRHAQVIEPGSGASIKIKLLIGALEEPVSYVPFEISPQILGRTSKEIATEFPHVQVQPISGDFTQPVDIPSPHYQTKTNNNSGSRVIFFPGSTIGNFPPADARRLLKHFATLAGDEGMIFIGVDRVKPYEILERAYDDEQGVTEAFNKNILHRINRELGAQIDVDKGFRHHAYYNDEHNRIEMHLISLYEQTLHIGGKAFDFYQGESIHTENSYKYRPDDFIALVNDAGLQHVQHWSDEEQHFSIHCVAV